MSVKRHTVLSDFLLFGVVLGLLYSFMMMLLKLFGLIFRFGWWGIKSVTKLLFTFNVDKP